LKGTPVKRYTTGYSFRQYSPSVQRVAPAGAKNLKIGL